MAVYTLYGFKVCHCSFGLLCTVHKPVDMYMHLHDITIFTISSFQKSVFKCLCSNVENDIKWSINVPSVRKTRWNNYLKLTFKTCHFLFTISLYLVCERISRCKSMLLVWFDIFINLWYQINIKNKAAIFPHAWKQKVYALSNFSDLSHN